MSRLFLAAMAVVVVSYGVQSQEPAPKNGALPKSNQVYVKIILPTNPATRNKDRPVVESWIAEHLKKRGQTKFTGATAWVPLGAEGEIGRRVWDGRLDGVQEACSVQAEIVERAEGRIKLHFLGWGPGGDSVTVSLRDEPGSREIAAGERLDPETQQRRPFAYVAVLIGPPPEKPAATDEKK